MNRKSGTAIGVGMAALAAAAIAAAPAALAQEDPNNTATNTADVYQINDAFTDVYNSFVGTIETAQANVADIAQAAIAGSEHILVLP
jgi:hypothetical protein